MTSLILIFGMMALMGLASKNVQTTFKRFARVPIRSRVTGAQAARRILDQNGLQNVRIERVQGKLTDHYDSRDKVLRLSESVYDQPSISAVGVAAHEAGHALQDKSGYFALQVRQSIVPFANIGGTLSTVLLTFGLIMVFIGLKLGMLVALAGLALYSITVLFTLITLPVEFNASSRAMVQLNQNGIISNEESAQARKVLNAAAMTYVAAALSAIVTLLYYAMIIFGGSSDD